MLTSERLRRLLNSQHTPLSMRASLKRSLTEVERYEAQERARILAAAAGPQAATEPPWGWGSDREAA